jgi:small-conductance mechanosensitive channel
VAGEVMRVGWHSTTLESAADGSVLIVPNSNVSTVPVRNMSRREKRIVRETLSLDDMVGRCTVKVFD